MATHSLEFYCRLPPLYRFSCLSVGTAGQFRSLPGISAGCQGASWPGGGGSPASRGGHDTATRWPRTTDAGVQVIGSADARVSSTGRTIAIAATGWHGGSSSAMVSGHACTTGPCRMGSGCRSPRSLGPATAQAARDAPRRQPHQRDNHSPSHVAGLKHVTGEIEPEAEQDYDDEYGHRSFQAEVEAAL
jgi:hypothetical protein